MLKKIDFLIFTAYFILLFVLYQFIIFNSLLGEAVFSSQQLETNKTALGKSVRQTMVHDAGMAEFAVLYGGGETKDAATANVERVLKYMNKNFTSVPGIDAVESDSVSTIIITTDNLDEVGGSGKIKAFLQSGGNVIFGVLPTGSQTAFNEIRDDIGIVWADTARSYNNFKITNELFMGGDLQVKKKTFRAAPTLLRGGCKVFAFYSFDDEKWSADNPMVWRTYLNGGCVVVVNGNVLADPYSMGLITSLIAVAQEDFAYPIVNAKALFLDGLPVLTEQNPEEIFRVYNRTLKQLLQEIVWPDLAAISREHQFVYSFLYSYGFNEFNSEQSADYSQLRFFSTEVLKYTGELCMSGYITATRGMAAPVDEAVYTNALAASCEAFSRYLPNYHINCFKPNDRYVAEYEKTLTQMLPGAIGRIGFYGGTDSDFKNDFAHDEFIEIPIATEGIQTSDELKWRAQNFVIASGYIAHYFDVRELINKFNSEIKWDKISKDFAAFTDEMYKRYPWVEKEPASGAAKKIQSFLNGRAVFKYEKNGVFISEAGQGEFYILNTVKRISAVNGCTLTKIDDRNYLIKMNGESASVGFAE